MTLQTAQNVRSKTFFQRYGSWEDSTITKKQKKEMIEIKRYSAEYFRLARDLGTDASHYLALEGTVTVVIQGQAYQLKD